MSSVPMASRCARMRVNVSSTARWSPAANSTNAERGEQQRAPPATARLLRLLDHRPQGLVVRAPSSPGRRRRASGSGTPSPTAPARAGRSPRSSPRRAARPRPSCRPGTRRSERWACRSARQSSWPRRRYHSSSTAWRARAASKSSTEWKWISGIVLLGASGPAFASSSRQRSSSSGRGCSARRSPAQNRSALIEATAPGARSGSKAARAASARSIPCAGWCATV